MAELKDIEREPPHLVQPFYGNYWLRPCSLTLSQACAATRQIFDALEACHTVGLSHGHIRAKDIIRAGTGSHFKTVLTGFWHRRVYAVILINALHEIEGKVYGH